jgi:hypothetical protein
MCTLCCLSFYFRVFQTNQKTQKTNSETLSESSNAIDIQNLEMVILEDDLNFFNNNQSSLIISPDESSSSQLSMQGTSVD